MDLIVYQMMQLQVMHVSDGRRAVEVLSGTSVTQQHLSVSGNRNALPQRSVVTVLIQIIQNLRKQLITMLLLELIPLHIYIVICKIQSVHDIVLVRTIKYRCRYVETKRFCSKAQVNLQNLSDIHSGRNAQRIQHDIKWTSIRKEWHILYRKYTGNDTLVTMTSCHFIADRDFSLLCNINTYRLIHSGS